MKPGIAVLLVLLAATGAPAAAQLAPVDDSAAAEACGGDLTYDQVRIMPKAEVARRLGCFTREAARQLNLQLPVKVDPVTTLEQVTAEGTTLIYRYSADVLRGQVAPEALEAAKAGVRAKVCQSQDMRDTIGIGGVYRYIWNDRAGERLGELVVASCEPTAPVPQPIVT